MAVFNILNIIDLFYVGVQPYGTLLSSDASLIDDVMDVIHPVLIPISTSTTHYQLIQHCESKAVVPKFLKS